MGFGVEAKSKPARSKRRRPKLSPHLAGSSPDLPPPPVQGTVVFAVVDAALSTPVVCRPAH